MNFDDEQNKRTAYFEQIHRLTFAVWQLRFPTPIGVLGHQCSALNFWSKIGHPLVQLEGGVMQKPTEESFPKSVPGTAEEHPTSEEIAVRAYELYIERGATPGQDVDDWLQAEAELAEEQKKPGRIAKSARA